MKVRVAGMRERGPIQAQDEALEAPARCVSATIPTSAEIDIDLPGETLRRCNATSRALRRPQRRCDMPEQMQRASYTYVMTPPVFETFVAGQEVAA